MHVCEIIYKIGADDKVYGDINGICRVTGQESKGILFDEWVKSTFNDWAYLKPGNIISNEALFCFEERSELIQRKVGKDKPQRFRTYSHIIWEKKWYCVTKAKKEFIYDAIVNGAEIVSLTDTGQKHIFFKHRLGMWQLDDLFVKPDILIFKQLHKTMCDLMRLGFSQGEIITGQYKSNRIILAGPENWRKLEKEINKFRGHGIFDFAAWMLFISEEDKRKVQDMYKKKKLTKKTNKKGQVELWVN